MERVSNMASASCSLDDTVSAGDFFLCLLLINTLKMYIFNKSRLLTGGTRMKSYSRCFKRFRKAGMSRINSSEVSLTDDLPDNPKTETGARVLCASMSSSSRSHSVSCVGSDIYSASLQNALMTCLYKNKIKQP